MTVILDKNEFWSLAERKVKAMSRLSISIPQMAGSSYFMEQKLANAEVDGTFSLAGNTIQTASWVQATDTRNMM